MAEEQAFNQNEVDYSKFGAEADTVKELRDNPDGLYKLLKAKRDANGEAQQRREFLESLATTYGKDVDTLKNETRVYNLITKDKVRFYQLEDNEKAIAESLVKLGRIDAKDIGMPIQESNDIKEENKVSEGTKKQAVEAQDAPKIDKDIQMKLEQAEKLAAENARLRTESLLRKHGASEDAMEDLLQLYKSPEIPENTSDEDASKLLQEHINSFKEARPWGFNSGQVAPVSTHNAKISRPTPTTEYELAKQNRDVMGMLRNNRVVRPKQ